MSTPAIADLLTANTLRCQVSADDKNHALELLSELLAGAASDLNENEVLGSLIRRERLGSTGVGRGVAIPHGRIGGLESPVGALITLSQPIDFDAHDDANVDLMFGLMVPADCSQAHLDILAQIAEMLTNETFCTELRQLTDAEAVQALVRSYLPDA